MQTEYIPSHPVAENVCPWGQLEDPAQEVAEE